MVVFWWYNHPSHTVTATEKCDNNGKGWYFHFDDDNKMSYKHILLITYIWMGQFNTYKPHFCVENKEGNWDK